MSSGYPPLVKHLFHVKKSIDEFSIPVRDDRLIMRYWSSTHILNVWSYRMCVQIALAETANPFLLPLPTMSLSVRRRAYDIIFNNSNAFENAF